jgi:hypothetical protein
VHDLVTSGAYMGHPLLKAGELPQIPQPDAPGRAVITPPAGRYEIEAVCGRGQLAKLGPTQSELKEPAKGRPPQLRVSHGCKGQGCRSQYSEPGDRRL